LRNERRDDTCICAELQGVTLLGVHALRPACQPSFPPGLRLALTRPSHRHSRTTSPAFSPACRQFSCPYAPPHPISPSHGPGSVPSRTHVLNSSTNAEMLSKSARSSFRHSIWPLLSRGGVSGYLTPRIPNSPPRLISSIAFLPFSRSLHARYTFAPAWYSALHVSYPVPELPPVTMATCGQPLTRTRSFPLDEVRDVAG